VPADWIWSPTQEFIESTNVHRMMSRLGFRGRAEFLSWSRDNPEAFWTETVRETGIDWFEPYEKVLDSSRGVEWTRWFVGGKLNIAWNCLDRHPPDRLACLWEGEDGASRAITFGELRREASALAHALTRAGLVKGDRVALYMPMVPETVAILYACLKAGLIVTPIFSGFGPAAVATRLADSGARALFTCDFLERRGKRIALKQNADEALSRAGAVEKVIVGRYKGGEIPWNPRRDVWWDDFVAGQPADFDSARMNSEDPAFLLYTSGTTGLPKGAVHTHAGALVETAKEIHLGFDLKRDERFFWVSDIGWMMGPWQIIGVHNFGAAILLYDGAPDYPRADRFWDIIERRRINIFGVSPTAIRLLMRSGAGAPRAHDLSSLRILGSTGEPWDETSYRWYFDHVGGGRCPVINISGGTEIIGAFVHPLPIQPLKPCTVGGPSPGMAADVVGEDGKPVRGRQGYLVCAAPAPSMTRGLWNAPERYIEAYWSRFPGVWFHGDWATVDEDGYWFLHGRADESFNVAGRKVGPAEVEEALIEHPAVSEAAVIGVPDELTGESIVAFVRPKSGGEIAPGAMEEIGALASRSLGPALRPKAIYVVPELPKTQSGKIVRRAIRRAYLGEDPGDVSTIENPASLKLFARR
jgi:acetyl-CoA synthetase